MVKPDWLLEEASTGANLELAFDLLVKERTRNESYCDWDEVENALASREQLIKEVDQILRNPDTYVPDPAFLYSFPKDRWISRRMVYRSFRDALLKFALILPIAERVEPQMIETSFTNHRAKGKLGNTWLLAPYMSHSVRRWRTWKASEEKGTSCVLETDISTFYDSIAHEHVMNAVCRHAGLTRDSRGARLLEASLGCHLRYLAHHNGGWSEQSQMIHQGLSTGCAADAILANILLMDLDTMQNRHPKVRYGRYADDILVFGPSQQSLVAFVRDATQLLAALSLNLSKGKTRLECGQLHVQSVVSNADSSLSEIGDAELDYEPDGGEPPDLTLDYNYSPAFDEPLDIAEIVQTRARDFCKFMSHGQVDGIRPLPVEKRTPAHLGTLARIIQESTFAAKHAVWLVVESFISTKTAPAVKTAAKAIILDNIASAEAHPYVRQRFLHHLVRPRGTAQAPKARWIHQYFVHEDFADLAETISSLRESDDLAVRRAAVAFERLAAEWTKEGDKVLAA